MCLASMFSMRRKLWVEHLFVGCCLKGAIWDRHLACIASRRIPGFWESANTGFIVLGFRKPSLFYGSNKMDAFSEMRTN